MTAIAPLRGTLEIGGAEAARSTGRGRPEGASGRRSGADRHEPELVRGHVVDLEGQGDLDLAVPSRLTRARFWTDAAHAVGDEVILGAHRHPRVDVVASVPSMTSVTTSRIRGRRDVEDAHARLAVGGWTL